MCGAQNKEKAVLLSMAVVESPRRFAQDCPKMLVLNILPRTKCLRGLRDKEAEPHLSSGNQHKLGIIFKT